MGEILRDGECRGVDNRFWFGDDEEDRQIGKTICRRLCPVQEHCLLYGESSKETRDHGTYGGYDEDERYKMRRQRRRLVKLARERFVEEHR